MIPLYNILNRSWRCDSRHFSLLILIYRTRYSSRQGSSHSHDNNFDWQLWQFVDYLKMGVTPVGKKMLEGNKTSKSTLESFLISPWVLVKFENNVDECGQVLGVWEIAASLCCDGPHWLADKRIYPHYWISNQTAYGHTQFAPGQVIIGWQANLVYDLF